MSNGATDYEKIDLMFKRWCKLSRLFTDAKYYMMKMKIIQQCCCSKDADLEKSQNDNEDFGFGEKNIHKEDKKLSKYSSHLYAWGRCGVNQSTGELTSIDR